MREQQTFSGGQNYVSHQNDGDNLAQQYESTFTDMAYQAFNTRFPESAPYVTTFQVIISDIEEGSAVGAFLLNISDDIYHVPVVMSDNNIKPMDMIYSKEMDKFFPFTPEWLTVVENMSQNSEGQAVHQKSVGVQVPYDVTQMLQPPTAAYRGGLGLSPTGMSKMPGMNTIAGDDIKDVPKFIDLLKVASNETKDKFVEMLKDNEGVFKFAVEKYAMEDIKKSIQHTKEKTPSKADVKNDELRVLDLESPVEKIKEVFQGSAVKAMEDIAKRGFTAKDDRISLNKLYDVESTTSIEEVKKSCFANICKRDVSSEVALVLTNLVPLRGPYKDYDDDYSDDSMPVANEQTLSGKGQFLVSRPRKSREKLVIFSDGRFFKTDRKIAAKTVIPGVDDKNKFDKIMTVSNPKRKDAVTFVKICKDTFVGVQPFYIDKVVMEPSGTTRYCELDPYYYESSKNRSMYKSDIGNTSKGAQCQVALLPSLPTAAKPFYSEDRETLYLEKGFTPVVLGEVIDEKEFLLDTSSILTHLKNKAYSAKAIDVKVSNRGGDDYAVNGKPSGTKKETTEKVAMQYHVPFEAVYTKIASLENRGDYTSLLVVPFEKNASIFMGTPGSQLSPEMVQEQAQEQQAQAPMQYEMPAQPQSYMDPSLMQSGADLRNEEIYNLGAIQSIVEDPKVMEMMQEYTPALEKAMDHTARLLLTLWTEGGKHKENLGALKFKELEDSARNAFKELGKLLLLVTKHPGEIE